MLHPLCCSSRAGTSVQLLAGAKRTLQREDRAPPHLLALHVATALTTLRTATPATIAPALTSARLALGDIIATWGSAPTGEQARSHAAALLNPGALPSPATLRQMADTWRDTAGRLAARAGARLPEGTVTV